MSVRYRLRCQAILANFMHYDGHALVILSESNEIYSANGTCQCKAFAHGKPCWHRAAARLVTRYNERCSH